MTEKKDRIIFLDIMRAIAVIMMVQGHTVHTLLAPEFRTADSAFYSVWYFLRGFTAPIFMFTSGVVFTYLFKLNGKDFNENPRVKKGINRFFLLIFIGYLLRYPTWRIVDFSYVSSAQFSTFFAVDALHLIGTGLLTIVLLFYFNHKIKIDYKLLAGTALVILIAVSPTVKTYNWNAVFPLWLADYFTNQYGSLFPLFPWLAYVIAGSLLGNYLAGNRGVQRKVSFALSLASIGSVLLLFSFFSGSLLHELNVSRDYLSQVNLTLFRIGAVLLLNSVVAFTVLEVKRINRLILLLGRNTLLIYALHLIILYGSAWTPGISKYLGESFGLASTLLSVAVMFLFIILLVTFMDKSKKIKKKVLSLVGA